MRRRARYLLGVALLALAGCGRPPPPADAPALLRQAWGAYRLGDYDIASKGFDRALALPGLDRDLELKALYGKACAWDLRQPVPSQDDALASNLYAQIIVKAPGHDLAAWSGLALARMAHLVPVGQEPDYARVRAAYQQVIDRFPLHPAGQEALIYQQATLIQSLDAGQTAAAIARLQAFLAEQTNSPLRTAAWNLLAQGYETLGRHAEQLEARIQELQTLEIDPASPASSDCSWRYWQLATTAEFLVGRFDIARVYYQRLIDEYPLDFRKFPARQALARMDRIERELRGGPPP